METIMLVTPTWQGQPWYPRALQKIIQDLILLPKTGKELLKPDSLKHHLMENRTLKLMVWAVSEKKLIAEGHSKKAALRFSDSSRKGSINHHDKLEKLE